MKQKGLF